MGAYLVLYPRVRVYTLVPIGFFVTTIALPAWNWERSVPGPAGTMRMFDAVTDDLSKARPGTFLFAHILLPHYPYIFDSACNQRPAHKWLIRSDPDRVNVTGGIVNVPEGRAVRYAAYLEQIHVFDASHQPVANATIVSATGTDWTTTVPEPSSLASHLAAALALVATSGRSRSPGPRPEAPRPFPP